MYVIDWIFVSTPAQNKNSYAAIWNLSVIVSGGEVLGGDWAMNRGFCARGISDLEEDRGKSFLPVPAIPHRMMIAMHRWKGMPFTDIEFFGTLILN
jgi:hypothetical protein